MADHGTTISAEPDDDEFDAPLIPGTIMWVLYEIRRRTVGGKPDLGDLPDAVDAYIREAIAADRQRIAAEIEARALESPPNGARVGLMIAARIVRRGRRLTAAEQMANLSNALADG